MSPRNFARIRHPEPNNGWAFAYSDEEFWKFALKHRIKKYTGFYLLKRMLKK